MTSSPTTPVPNRRAPTLRKRLGMRLCQVPEPLRIAVAGGSIGGLCAGLALRGAGFDVQVYESASGPMETRGAGIVVQGELIDLLTTSAESETPRDPAQVRAPGWVGRVLFRQATALLTRKDHGPNRGLASRGVEIRLLHAGVPSSAALRVSRTM